MDPTQTNAATAPGRFEFSREAFRSFRTTGAFAPSSRYLAAKLAAPLSRPERRNPVRVLEVGAGTGVVTRELADRLGPSDRLDVVEVNPHFVRTLDSALHNEFALSAVADRIRLHERSILDVALEHQYDVVVSGLPFTNFDPGQVRAMLQRHVDLLVPGGDLTFFGYLGTQGARSLLSRRDEARRHRAAVAVEREFVERYGRDRATVWLNLPPAHVWHLRAPDADR
ncbi:class I SAM-dependent methyltransferase [Saccharopolyspora gloriosae]|uniref:class I SAM-dependent methyltransferase n=1 Tax=Saccharopolyspora gloriosae TaxID=455344 RepID=UPI001FB798DD|nr:methyltransferase domain-containing protein [Saccharopolyspora gloriosae]